MFNILTQAKYHPFIMINDLTLEEMNTMTLNINELQNWKSSISVRGFILDASILQTNYTTHGINNGKSSMMDIFSLINHPRNKEILVIEPTKFSPSNPSSWKELYKYIQLAALQNGISLGVKMVGSHLVTTMCSVKEEEWLNVL